MYFKLSTINHLLLQSSKNSGNFPAKCVDRSLATYEIYVLKKVHIMDTLIFVSYLSYN